MLARYNFADLAKEMPEFFDKIKVGQCTVSVEIIA